MLKNKKDVRRTPEFYLRFLDGFRGAIERREVATGERITQADLAELLGVAQSSVSSILNGAAIPREGVLARMEEVMREFEGDMRRPAVTPAAPAGVGVQYPATQCRTCHSMVPFGEFCFKCGAPLGVACWRCGQLNPQGAAHCMGCGVNLPQGDPLKARIKEAVREIAAEEGMLRNAKPETKE